MADLKISQLTGASTPLAGTEVLPIVQSGSTVKVSVANLTAGRAVASAGGTFSDNFVQSTAAKGVNFTANTPAAGMTSQLLNWYEEGTWTVTWTSLTGTPSNTKGYYTRIGRLVFFTYDAGANSITSVAGTTKFSLPFNPATYAVGSMISQTVGSAGSVDIEPGSVAYPEFFTSTYMVFSGCFHV